MNNNNSNIKPKSQETQSLSQKEDGNVLVEGIIDTVPTILENVKTANQDNESLDVSKNKVHNLGERKICVCTKWMLLLCPVAPLS